jgi:hypothetical protein
MKLSIRILAMIALLGSAAIIYDTVDIQAHGAFITNGIERFSGASLVAMLLSDMALFGEIALLAATVIGVVMSVRQRMWVWGLAAIVAFILSLYAWFDAGFTANPFSALLTLIAPVVLLAFSWQASPRHSTTALSA